MHLKHLSKTVKDNERLARSNTRLRLHDNGDGTWSGRFTIPELRGSMLKAALENLSSPRRYRCDKAGNEITDDTVNYGVYDWHGMALL